MACRLASLSISFHIASHRASPTVPKPRGCLTLVVDPNFRQASSSSRATRTSCRRVTMNRRRTKMSRSFRADRLSDGRSRYAARAGSPIQALRPGSAGIHSTQRASRQETTRRPRAVNPERPSGPVCTHPRPRPKPPTTAKAKMLTTKPTAKLTKNRFGVGINPNTTPPAAPAAARNTKNQRLADTRMTEPWRDSVRRTSTRLMELTLDDDIQMISAHPAGSLRLRPLMSIGEIRVAGLAAVHEDP
jgi:hypothetical protein